MRPRDEPDPVDALTQLATMRERGLITVEEYEAKKGEVLGRMGQPAPTGPATPPAGWSGAAAPQPRKGRNRGKLLFTAIVLIGIAGALSSRPGTSASKPQAATTTAAPVQAWEPAGFTLTSDPSVAYRWIDKPTCELADTCWAIEAISKDGCANSLYIELAISDGNGSAVGYTNDVAGSVQPGQRAKLLFENLEKTGKSASISKVSCY